MRDVDFVVPAQENYDNGGTVELLKPLPAGNILAIYRQMTYKQSLSLPEYGKLPSGPLEDCLDKIYMLMQEHAEILSRCIKASRTSNDSPEKIFEDYISEVTAVLEETKEVGEMLLADCTTQKDQCETSAEAALSAKNQTEQLYNLFPTKVAAANTAFDSKVTAVNTAFDSKVTAVNTAFDSKVTAVNGEVDQKFADLRAELARAGVFCTVIAVDEDNGSVTVSTASGEIHTLKFKEV